MQSMLVRGIGALAHSFGGNPGWLVKKGRRLEYFCHWGCCPCWRNTHKKGRLRGLLSFSKD